RGLDLERRNIDATDFQHVVAAARIGVAAVVGIAHVFVAGLGPAALEGLAGLRAVAPVHDRARRAMDVQVARFAVWNLPAIIAAQLDLVARHRPAGAAQADPVRTVR